MDFAAEGFTPLPDGRGTAPRSVAQLAFAEILMIWALRRFAACLRPREARLAAIAPELTRAFGIARLEGALAAFAVLAETLGRAARLPQAFAPVEDDNVNATEEAVLATLAALQRGEAAQAEALGQWCLLPAGRGAFLTAARTLAQALREAGHVLPYRAPRRRAFLPADGRPATRLSDAPTVH